MKRYYSNELARKIGQQVLLEGWIHSRRAHGKINFIDLRDKNGLTQVVVLPNSPVVKLAKLPLESCVSIMGEVVKRPESMVNSKIASGTIEVQPKNLTVYSVAKTPPFELGQTSEVEESTRLRYRYLDLRSPRMQKNILFRHRAYQFVRRHLTQLEFVEVSTPTLTKSTPEGARDFLVPSRNYPGKFYALPQSPQQYKQLLMVAGIEKYFQIVSCFRDEDTRQDRQAEFTQVDIETSFVDENFFIELVEKMVCDLVKVISPQKHITLTPFPRITYAQAIKRYGTDRPDLRKNQQDKNELAFVWITDFPMFEKKQDGSYGAQHHPFTRIKKPYLKDFESNPEKTLAHQFDLALNGEEIAGGGLRTYESKILERVFQFLGLSNSEIKVQFGHLLEAFEYGVPPHGGVAIGFDRFLMILLNQKSIREVIAFPKTGDGFDPLMNSPSKLSSEQLKELSLKVDPQQE